VFDSKATRRRLAGDLKATHRRVLIGVVHATQCVYIWGRL
jgi:hypothetical protein